MKILNYGLRYQSRGKFIYVPTEQAVRKGRRILKFFESYEFPDYFYHYKSGGHVAALHAHLRNKHFFKIDLQNFYYTIARMRVTRALRSHAFPGANTLAMWSCVKNPHPIGPSHILPIGFVQSPLLASLVLLRSPVSKAMEKAIAEGICISVYMDDFIGSHDDRELLMAAYSNICDAVTAAGLILNPAKLTPPADAITAFNCDLRFGSANVTLERVTEHESQADRTAASEASFNQYRALVASNNTALPRRS